MRAVLWLSALLLAGISPLPAVAGNAAPGSWHATAPRVLVTVSGRETRSDDLLPPPQARGQRLAQVRWRFHQPAPLPLPAWLCHPQRCVALDMPQGVTRALEGLDAGQPLHFRFRRDPGHPAQEVRDLQLFVHYR